MLRLPEASMATARNSLPVLAGTVTVEPVASFVSAVPMVSHHSTVIFSFSGSLADFTCQRLA